MDKRVIHNLPIANCRIGLIQKHPLVTPTVITEEWCFLVSLGNSWKIQTQLTVKCNCKCYLLCTCRSSLVRRSFPAISLIPPLAQTSQYHNSAVHYKPSVTMPANEKKPFARLPSTVVPSNYNVTLTPNLTAFTFTGEQTITVQVFA